MNLRLLALALLSAALTSSASNDPARRLHLWEQIVEQERDAAVREKLARQSAAEARRKTCQTEFASLPLNSSKDLLSCLG